MLNVVCLKGSYRTRVLYYRIGRIRSGDLVQHSRLPVQFSSDSERDCDVARLLRIYFRHFAAGTTPLQAVWEAEY